MSVATTTATRRPRSPQGEGARLRDELIAAAGRILDRTGDEEGLTLRAVAREAGVAAPSVYLHFASKDELIMAVELAYFAELRRLIEAATAPLTDPIARLRAGCLAYCDFAVQQPGAYRVLFGTARPPFAGLPHAEAPGLDAFNTLVTAIADCMAAGLALAGDPFRVATSVWAALHGLVSLRRFAPSFPWPPLPDLVDDALVGLVGLDRAAIAPEACGPVSR